MKRGMIPKHLHFETPNAHVDWEGLPVKVTSAPMEWPGNSDRPPLAAVSAFGISGTNAHVIVEGYPAPDNNGSGTGDAGQLAGPERAVPIAMPEPLATLPATSENTDRRTARVLPLSGKSPEALRDLARRYLDWLKDRAHAIDAASGAADAVLSDMAWTAGVGRDHFPHRAGLAFCDAETLQEQLQAVARADEEPAAPGVSRTPKLAFCYGADGAVGAAMASSLYRSEPVARAILDRCNDVLLEENGGTSLIGTMFDQADANGNVLERQTALFALQCAVTALWASVGIRPHAVSGLGIGELAAAWASGALGLEDGLRLASARNVREVLSGIAFSAPSISVARQATGKVIDPAEFLDGASWREHVPTPDEPQRPAQALTDVDVDLVLEIGPELGLDPAPPGLWPNGGGRPASTFEHWVARAYDMGLPVSFAGLFAGELRRRISVPGYPFQRKRFWF